MRNGAIFSGILHLSIFVVLVFGLPSFVTPLEVTPPIPVELVVLEEELEVPEPELEPEPVKEAEPEPEPEPEPVQQAKQPPTPAPAVAEPLPPEPEPELEPEVAELIQEPEPPAPQPQAKPEAPEPPKPAAPAPPRKPKVTVVMPEEEKEPPPETDFTSVLNSIDDLRTQMAAKPATETTKAAPEPTPQGSQIEQMEMVRAIQSQLARCWQLEPGARDAANMIVEIRVALNPNGAVRDAKIVDSLRMVSDSFFRSAAENARRAVYRCSPFDLPVRKYEIWQVMTLRFDPRQMFGG
ncbi:MAG: hypothetical protein AAF495_18865 [Pseudomonadota bacterium]